MKIKTPIINFNVLSTAVAVALGSASFSAMAEYRGFTQENGTQCTTGNCTANGANGFLYVIGDESKNTLTLVGKQGGDGSKSQDWTAFFSGTGVAGFINHGQLDTLNLGSSNGGNQPQYVIAVPSAYAIALMKLNGSTPNIKTVNVNGIVKGGEASITLRDASTIGIINVNNGGELQGQVDVGSGSRIDAINIEANGAINSSTQCTVCVLGGKVGTITNAGTIQGGSKENILVHNGGTVERIVSTGTFNSNGGTAINLSTSGSKVGSIEFGDGSNFAGSITVGVSVASGASVGDSTQTNADAITITKGADLSGLTGGAVSVNGGGNVFGNINTASDKDLKVNNSGTVNGTVTNTGAGITTLDNKGAIGSGVQNTGAGDIVLNNSKNIAGGVSNTGTGDVTVENNAGGTIEGGVTDTSTGNATITNRGTINGAVSNTNGSLTLNTAAGSNIGGSVTHSGDGSFTGDVNGTITGDLTTSGSGTTTMTGSGTVTGSLTLGNSGKSTVQVETVGGNVSNSGNGQLDLTIGQSVGGDITTSGTGSTNVVNNGSIVGGIKDTSTGNTSSTITNNGTIAGGVTKNEGSLNIAGGANSTITGDVQLSGGSGNLNITGTGTINGNVVNNSTGTSSSVNAQNITGNVVNQGGGSMNLNVSDKFGGSLTNTPGGTINVGSLPVNPQTGLTIAGGNPGGVHFGQGSLELQMDGNVNQTIDTNALVKDEAGNSVVGQLNGGQGILNGTTITGTGAGSELVDWKKFDKAYLDQTGGLINPTNAVIPTTTPGAFVTEGFIRLASRKTMVIDSILGSAERDHMEGKSYIEASKPGISVLPYGSYNKVDMESRGTSLKANTAGIIGMAHAPLQNGNNLLTGYLGYESSNLDSDPVRMSQTVTVKTSGKDNTVYGGIKYLHTFADNGTYRWFGSAHVKGSYTSADVDLDYSNGSSYSSKASIYGFGATVFAGLNWQVTEKDVITPRLGLGYEHVNVKDFNLIVDNPSQSINMYIAEGGVSWTRAWMPGVATVVTGGFKANLDRSITIDTVGGDADVKIAPVYGFGRAGVVIAPNERINYSLNYTGVFADDGASHSGFVKVNFLF